MEIKNSEVYALRQKTGFGMMDCKKALMMSDDNMEEAAKYLAEKVQLNMFVFVTKRYN